MSLCPPHAEPTMRTTNLATMVGVAKRDDPDEVVKIDSTYRCGNCGEQVEDEGELLVSYARYACEAAGIDWRN